MKSQLEYKADKFYEEGEYYLAGQYYLLCDMTDKANECFELAGEFPPEAEPADETD